MIDADELAAFVAIADTSSFNVAADRLGVVQSVVSKRIARLEGKIGARLIDRTNKRSIAMTRVGQLFLDDARETVLRLQIAERLGRSLGRGEAGPVRIGYVFSAAMAGLVTRLARALRETRPGLDLHFSMLETPEQFRALAEGRIDIALARPRPSYPPQTRCRPVHREGVVLGIAASHRLGGRTRVSMRDLDGECFVVPQFQESVGLIEHIQSLARKGGFHALPVVTTPDYVTAASLSAAGIGLVLAPSSLRHLDLPGLRFADIDDFSAELSLVLAHRSGMPQQLADVIEQAIPTLGNA